MAELTNNISFERRSSEILNYLKNNQTISVDTVVELCSVSHSTARSQLGKMDELGLLTRTHGGAIKNDTLPTVSSAHFTNLDEKERIAQKAASLVMPGDTIAIAAGTTVQLFARALRNASDIVVATNSIYVALELKDNPNIEVHLCGGVIKSLNGACTGKRAESFFEGLHVSKSFFGIDSVDSQAEFTVRNPDERADQAVISCGQKKYVLFDHSKFERGPFVDKLSSFDEVDVCIIDKETKNEYVSILQNAGIEVILV